MLGGKGVPVPGAPSSWKWQVDPEDTLYCGLFPRSWTVYSIPQVSVYPTQNPFIAKLSLLYIVPSSKFSMFHRDTLLITKQAHLVLHFRDTSHGSQIVLGYISSLPTPSDSG